MPCLVHRCMFIYSPHFTPLTHIHSITRSSSHRYAPSLRQLRQHSLLLHFPPIVTSRLASRLHQVAHLHILLCLNGFSACSVFLRFQQNLGIHTLPKEIFPHPISSPPPSFNLNGFIATNSLICANLVGYKQGSYTEKLGVER